MSWKIIFIYFPIIVSTYQIISDQINDATEEKNYLRTKFLNDKKKNIVAAKQIKLLEKYAANDSVFIDDILHYQIDGHPLAKQVNKIEEEFRNMLAMDGLTYIYNRDMVWRTWRKVPFDKKARIVHYKYVISSNCSKHCDDEGYWVIEKYPPPCDLEIFSIDEKSVCALNMRHYHLKTLKCSSHLFSFVTTTCDNPIVTKWIVQKTFSKKEKKQRFPVIICGGREYCRISTVYKINPDHVSFKILNSTNHITYSRIMKNTGNYACLNDCGIFDQKTNTVKKSEKPLKLNFIINKKIAKREKKHEKVKDIENEQMENMKSYILSHFEGLKSTTESHSCKNLRHHHDFYDDVDDEDVNYD